MASSRSASAARSSSGRSNAKPQRSWFRWTTVAARLPSGATSMRSVVPTASGACVSTSAPPPEMFCSRPIARPSALARVACHLVGQRGCRRRCAAAVARGRGGAAAGGSCSICRARKLHRQDSRAVSAATVPAGEPFSRSAKSVRRGTATGLTWPCWVSAMTLPGLSPRGPTRLGRKTNRLPAAPARATVRPTAARSRPDGSTGITTRSAAAMPVSAAAASMAATSRTTVCTPPSRSRAKASSTASGVLAMTSRPGAVGVPGPGRSPSPTTRSAARPATECAAWTAIRAARVEVPVPLLLETNARTRIVSVPGRSQVPRLRAIRP
jgi:hypothetical protein